MLFGQVFAINDFIASSMPPFVTSLHEYIQSVRKHLKVGIIIKFKVYETAFLAIQTCSKISFEETEELHLSNGSRRQLFGSTN